ncbi:DUF4381 domain-containing protein [Marinomonas sp. CT5]|uniref:DUF4381 domain-containing protein n=1 Tax=Marinomonas sp. CT5 TaxID=2066133 RepID=UPI001BB01627|nr:DUF4381 domain-containing protein [Marinomonas sp. CT5]QUX95455.1 DUF4381 domain-containing protein [Marinomonas sp. CT5]
MNAPQAPQQTIDLPNTAYMLPQSVPMWPPAWWTWLVVAAIVILIIALIFLAFKRHKKRGYRREALSNINKHSPELTDKDCIVLCHEMVRRCLISEDKTEMAALPTKVLFEELDKSLPTKKAFSALGNKFVDGPYRNQVELTTEQRSTMIKTTCYWIRKHHA